METFPSSRPQSIALIEFDGPAMRYAGVRTDVGNLSFFRFGVCEFDFDVEVALLEKNLADKESADSAHQETIAQALEEVFGEVALTEMRVVVHPGKTLACYSLTPLNADQAGLDIQFREEVALLADVAEPDLQAVTATPSTKTEVLGTPHRWHHLLYMEPATWGRIKGLAARCGVETVRVVDSSISASAVTAESDDSEGVTLRVGIYPGRTEVSVRQGGHWLRSHHGAVDSSEDIAYYALDLLRQVGFLGEDVQFFEFYGSEADARRLDLLASFFPVEPRRIDRFDGIGENITIPEEEVGAFVPLMGAVTL